MIRINYVYSLYSDCSGWFNTHFEPSFSIVADERQRNKMKAVEDKLDKAGVTPSGSTLSHGMYVNKSNGELVADQKPSAVWYKRLI